MSRAIASLFRFLVLCSGLFACAAEVPAIDAGAAPTRSVPTFCARAGDDLVRDVFCADPGPQIGGFQDLLVSLGMVFDEAQFGPVDEPAVPSVKFLDFPDLGLVMLNSSTTRGGRRVSTINPRAIVLTPSATMAFNRGVQEIELMSRDRSTLRLNMYLLSFQQSCNAVTGGCSPGDLYTPRIESNWTRVRIEDDEDLKNTAADCRQCHQRARDEPIMLMRELDGPWPHFFMAHTDPSQEVPDVNVDRVPGPNGVDVVRAYHSAKGDEPYGSIPWAALRSTSPFTLQQVVDRPQPLVFDGNTILNERWPWDKEQGFAEAPVASATWYREYEAFKRGEHLALPYYEVFVSDPDKLTRLTDAYRAFRAGAIDADSLPDLSDFYPEDPQVRAEMGLQTEPSASPAQTLIQACGTCHNDVLDQSISRARFGIDLRRLDRAALDAAVARISLPADDPAHMPPREFRQIDPGAIAPLIEYLQRDAVADDDAALLRRAAELGMAVDTARPARDVGP